MCAAAISGRAPWSKPLANMGWRELFAYMAVLLMLVLPVKAARNISIVPWGFDGGIDWAVFWGQQHAHELALHVHTGVEEEEAAALCPALAHAGMPCAEFVFPEAMIA